MPLEGDELAALDVVVRDGEAAIVQRGEVWWVQVDKRCPVVVLGHEGDQIRAMFVVESARGEADGLAVEVHIGVDEGLSPAGVVRVAIARPGFIPCTWLVTTSSAELIERVGALSAAKLRELDEALRIGGLD